MKITTFSYCLLLFIAYSMAVTLSVKDRAIGAIVGGLVADAAVMPVHWIYDVGKLDALLGDKALTPEFFNPPSCPFYQYELGTNTPYGDGVLHLLEFLANHQGQFDPVSYEEDALKFYDGGYKGRLNHSWKEFVKNVKEGKHWPNCGADDSQADGLTKAGVIAAAYYGKPELLAKTNEAVRVIQNTDKAAAMALAAASILEEVISGKNPSDAVKNVAAKLKHSNPEDELAKHIDNLLPKVNESHLEIVKSIGSSCGYPNSFVNTCHLLLNDSVDYVSAVRQTLKAGGDNASRAVFLGAVLGAKYGIAGIPKTWQDSTTKYNTIVEFAHKVTQHL